MENNQNKFKSILSKMNVDDKKTTNKMSSKRSKLDDKRMSARNKYKIQKSNRVIKKKRQQQPSILNRVIGFFTSGDTNKEYETGDDSLYDIQSRFRNQEQVQSIKRKLTSSSNKPTKSTYVDDSIFNFKGKNYYKTALLKNTPKEDESPLTLRQLYDKLLEYEKTISLLEKKVSDMSNEVTLMQQQHKQNNGFVDMSLIKEKRKINNLQSSDPVIDFDDNNNSNINDNLKKKNKHGDIRTFDKLSPIKRQNTFLGQERDSNILEASPKESAKRKANAITSSPTKTYKGNKLSNTNITRLLRNENNKSEDSYDWRQIEEDSISSSDIE
ncbi:uncharacterized protein HGUI_03101 [Hanseniaspora guilliermondii]|uniref:Uncharacterized protein n=1 Tax=Hanseniaspora guilliermondii TaxID=56406 RepID=A0A1L0CPK9_9ASCO|nr:uncharacterized protein HGUI_03101 [Hanseniaspora guilliermondii]